jgi:5-formyltetrahydrofolate cyclo-ligase
VNGPDSRDAQRRELMQLRITLTDRVALEKALAARVDDWLSQANVRAVGFFWPIRGEPDLRPTMGTWLARDERRSAALPVIAGQTLEFHYWTPLAPMRAGQHGIPVPAHGRVVQPDCLLIPCLGFDRDRYRLGYGGGFYDRTLASSVPWPLAVGIAFEATCVASIEPRPHDIRLDVVLTDAAQY